MTQTTEDQDMAFDFWLMALADRIQQRLDSLAQQPEEPQIAPQPLDEAPFVQPRKKKRKRMKQGKKGDPEVPRTSFTNQLSMKQAQPLVHPGAQQQQLVQPTAQGQPNWTMDDFPPLQSTTPSKRQHNSPASS